MTNLEQSVSEIESALTEIRHHFMYSEQLERKINKAINHDALAHSFHLEPDLTDKETLDRLTQAWDFSTRTFRGTFTEDLIKQIASQIEGNNQGYRQNSAYVLDTNGNPDIMINPQKIEREMRKLIGYMTESKKPEIIKATELHLYFVFIHPFSDGNGRTARLIQNLALFYHKIPPAIIPHTERATYLAHIEDARKAFKERNGQEGMFSNQTYSEYRFFEYILDKIKGSAEKLSRKISRQKKYVIDLVFRGGNNRQIYRVRDTLKNAFSAQGIIYELATSRQRRQLEIITCATPEWLIGSLERYKDKNHHLKGYELTDITLHK